MNLRTAPFSVILVAVLAGGACSDPTPADGSSPATYSPPPQAEVFTPADGEALQLGTIDYILSVEVDSTGRASGFPGSSTATVSITGVVWQAETKWRAGEIVSVEPANAGDEWLVLIDDAWHANTGDALVVGVTAEPVMPETNGYVQVVLNDDESVRSADPKTNSGAIAAFLTNVATHRGADQMSQELLKSLVLDARLWIEEVNTTNAGALPGGIFAELRSGTAAETDLLEVFMQTAPDLRQLPQRLDEIPGLEQAIGSPLAVSSFAIFTTDESQRYFALRFPGVGVIGPWSNTAEQGYARLFGVAPVSGEVEVLTWTADDPQPANAESLGIFELPPGWDPTLQVGVLDLANQDTARIEPVDLPTFSERIDKILRSVGSPDSEATLED